MAFEPVLVEGKFYRSRAGSRYSRFNGALIVDDTYLIAFEIARVLQGKEEVRSVCKRFSPFKDIGSR